MVGSMGCASSIGLGIALNTNKRTIIFDGDGATIMQMGTLATIGHYKPKKYFHFLFDNNVHDSTGGQPTVSNTVNFKDLSKACGYSQVFTVTERSQLIDTMGEVFQYEGPIMIIIKIKPGAREDLGRPKTSPRQNKLMFMNEIKKSSKKVI